MFGIDSFVVTVPSAEEREIRFSAEISVANDISCYGLEYVLDEPVNVSGSLSRQGKDVFLSLSLKGEVQTCCTRCLDPLRIAFDEVFLYLFSASQDIEHPSEQEDSDVEYLIVDVPSLEQTLDITEQVWESLILSLPQNPKCREECPGLCPFCGKKLESRRCDCAASLQDEKQTGFSVLKGMLTDES